MNLPLETGKMRRFDAPSELLNRFAKTVGTWVRLVTAK
jgi:hypothetical protein